MTFQYIRRRPHIPCYGNPFAVDWVEKDGVFVSNNWNAFYWKDTPKDIFSIWKIGVRSDFRGHLFYKVKRVDGSACPFQNMELQLGAISHVSTGKCVTVEELTSYMTLL